MTKDIIEKEQIVYLVKKLRPNEQQNLKNIVKNIFFKIKLELIYIEYSTMIIHLAIKIYITLFYKGI